MENLLTHKDMCPYYEENCINVGCVCPKYMAFERVNADGEIQKQLEKMNINHNLDKLNIMMCIQKHFSSRFFNLNELTEEEIHNWIKQYDTCINDEITEVHEHLETFNYIYGNKKINIKELQKEFIDIWHFAMDMFIIGGANTNDLLDNYLDLYQLEKTTKENRTLSFVFENERKEIKKDSVILIDNECPDGITILILTGHIMAGLRKIKQQINWKHWKKQKIKTNYKSLYSSFSFVLSSLIKCFIVVGLDCETLYNTYISKNIENIFRQEFGY
jgi:hypothetical protein